MRHEVGTQWLEILVAAKLSDCWFIKRVEDYFGFWRNNNGGVGPLCLLLSYRPTRVYL